MNFQGCDLPSPDDAFIARAALPGPLRHLDNSLGCSSSSSSSIRRKSERAIFRATRHTSRERASERAHTHKRTFTHTRVHLPHDTPYPCARVHPRGVGGRGRHGGLGRRGLSAVGGVIASAQIEYISYVFITTARPRATSSRAICHPRRHLSTPDIATAATAAATPRRRVAVVEGLEEGMENAKLGESERKRRVRRGAQKGGRTERRRRVGARRRGCRRASGRGWPREIKREEIPVD